MNFKDLYQEEEPILLCNVWDVASAKLAQKVGYTVIGTSSSAIATMLGYNDGEEISFDELEYIVGRIVKSINIPLTVDLEAGYSRNPEEIVEHIKRMEQLGVLGINLEDSIVNGNRTILSVDEFSRILSSVYTQLAQQNVNIFLNVRTDTYLLGVSNPLEQTIERAGKYADSGANGLFVPCIEKQEDIKVLVEHIALPLNVMCMPNLPDFETLMNLGVKRISMGNFVFNKLNNFLWTELDSIQNNRSFQNLFIQ